MEATFDNGTNVLNTHIISSLDTQLYSVETTFGFRGKQLTLLRDANPALSAAQKPVVGAIHWNSKTLEVNGEKKKFADVKRWQGNLFNRNRVWKWADEGKEYIAKYTSEEWRLSTDLSLVDPLRIVARLQAPSRPHLFTKSVPVTMVINQEALITDEVFLILIFIYSEAKRQDSNNSSVSAGSEGW